MRPGACALRVRLHVVLKRLTYCTPFLGCSPHRFPAGGLVPRPRHQIQPVKQRKLPHPPGYPVQRLCPTPFPCQDVSFQCAYDPSFVLVLVATFVQSGIIGRKFIQAPSPDVAQAKIALFEGTRASALHTRPLGFDRDARDRIFVCWCVLNRL